MAEAFMGEVRIFGFSYAPQGWAACGGGLMAIPQNAALFSLLGTTYGGDGTRTFGLPNLSDRIALGAGTSAAGTQYALGDMEGDAAVTMTDQNIPSHSHTFLAAAFRNTGNLNVPTGDALATAAGCTPYVLANTTPAPVSMSPLALTPTGFQSPVHQNLMPFTAVNFCICLYGEFPQRPS